METKEDVIVTCGCGVATTEEAVTDGGQGHRYKGTWYCPTCDEVLNELVAKELEELPF